MKTVGQPIRKKDAYALVTGKPVFTDDIAPKDCLVVKVLRSPHANAMVKNIRTDLAEKVEGIEAIYTWEDVPKERFTMAGQTYPEASPYDRLILDPHVRYVGDPVASPFRRFPEVLSRPGCQEAESPAPPERPHRQS